MVKSKLKLILLMFFGSIFLVTAGSIWALTPFFAINQIPKPAAELVAQREAEQQAEIDKNIPKSLYPCLPEQEQRLEARENTTYKQKKYFLVGLYGLPSTHQGVEVQASYEETLVALDNVGCQVIIPKEKMGTASLILYIPQAAAYDLKLQRYRKAITELGGKKKLEQLLQAEEQTTTPGDYPIYFPEDIWALKKLGINLPKNIKVINHADELRHK